MWSRKKSEYIWIVDLVQIARVSVKVYHFPTNGYTIFYVFLAYKATFRLRMKLFNNRTFRKMVKWVVSTWRNFFCLLLIKKFFRILSALKNPIRVLYSTFGIILTTIGGNIFTDSIKEFKVSKNVFTAL